MGCGSGEAAGRVLMVCVEGVVFTREASLPLQEKPDALTASCRGPKETVDISGMCSLVDVKAIWRSGYWPTSQGGGGEVSAVSGPQDSPRTERRATGKKEITME